MAAEASPISTEPAAREHTPRVLLVHGLGRTPISLSILSWRLRRSGWRTERFGYAAFIQSYQGIVERLRHAFRRAAARGPYAVVTHSLGAVLTRSALAPRDLPNPLHVVMMAPPNRPPLMAPKARMVTPWRWFTGECGEKIADPAFYDTLPTLPCPYTILTGTRGPTGRLSPFGDRPNDGVVAVDETRIADDDSVIEFPATHTFIMNKGTVQRTIVRILREALP